MDVTCDTSGSKCMFHGNFLLGWILASPSMATNFFWYLEAHSKSWAYRTVNVFLICSFYFTLLLACYSDFFIYRPCLYSTKHFTPGLAGVGGLIRNENGQWIARYARSLGIKSGRIAELWAVKYGLTLATTRWINSLCVKLDAELIV